MGCVMRPGPGTRVRQSLPFILTLFIVLMIVSSYSGTLTSPPYLDDFHSFIDDNAFYPHSLSVSALLALSRAHFGLARLLPDVTFALNHYLGHSGLIYFHAVNILIHLLVFFAALWFVSLVLAAEQNARPRAGLPYAPAGFFPLCVAAIWALSPVQTNAVTYLVQRMASMQTLFFTLSAACFIKARLIGGKKGRAAAVFFFPCALAGLCAGLSKENSAMLPAVLAVIDIWFFDSAWLNTIWAVCRKTGWKLRALAAATFLASSYYVFFVELPKILGGYSIRNFTLVQRLLTEARVVVWYMSLLAWPVPSRLAMEHYPLISTSLFNPFTTIPAILTIAALVFLAVRFRKRFPVITFGIVWFFMNLVIESTIVPLELVFEHRLYLPSIGFYLSVAALFAVLMRKAVSRLPHAEFAKAACSLLLVCASFFALLTFARNTAWKDGASIRLDTVEKAPENARANADYANILCEMGRHDEALKYAEKAIRLSKKGPEEYSLAQNAIAIALLKEGKTGEAIKREQKFLEIVASNRINVDAFPNVCLNVVQACLLEKRPKDAYKWALKALKYIQASDNSSYKKGLVEGVLLEIFISCNAIDLDPALTATCAAYLNRRSMTGGAFKTTGSLPAAPTKSMTPEAPGGCPASIPAPGVEDPAIPEVLTAMVFITHGEGEHARRIIAREHAKHPDDPLVKAAMAKLQEEDAKNLEQKKKWNSLQKYVLRPYSRFNFDMAVAYLVQSYHLPKLLRHIGKNCLDAALTDCPASRDAQLLEAWWLYNENDAVRAAQNARKLLARDPNNSKVWLALGFFLAKEGDNTEAVAAFRKVIELYPGYSQRTIVEGLCSQLNRGKNIESASARE